MPPSSSGQVDDDICDNALSGHRRKPQLNASPLLNIDR
jgi:hypothetical protein